MSQEGLEGAGQPLFQEKATVEPCSWNQCTAGHRWPVTMMAPQCGGCGANGIALKLESCPFCNEPAAVTTLRVDIVPVGAGYIPRCRGAKTVFATLDVLLERKEGAAAESTWKPFGQKSEAASEKPVT